MPPVDKKKDCKMPQCNKDANLVICSKDGKKCTLHEEIECEPRPCTIPPEESKPAKEVNLRVCSGTLNIVSTDSCWLF